MFIPNETLLANPEDTGVVSTMARGLGTAQLQGGARAGL